MDALDEGNSPTAIARELRVSRMTVYRLRAAARKQGRRVPKPKAMGGYRPNTARLSKEQQAAIASLALQRPKDTLEELAERAVQEGLVELRNDEERLGRHVVHRALRKQGIKSKRASFYDLKTRTDKGIVYERKVFRKAQQADPVLSHGYRLLFFDETLVRFNEQQRHGWAKAGQGARLPRPKGQTPTTSVLLTIGVDLNQGAIVHYKIYPPARPFEPLSSRYEAKELKEPGRGISIDVSPEEIKDLTVTELRAILKHHAVKLSDEAGRPLKKKDLVRTVLHLSKRGLVGLLRAQRGGRDLGGAKEPMRGKARDVVEYWLESVVPWAEEHGLTLADKTVVWDNAPSHSAVRTTQTARISVFHRWFREWGFRGVVFTPPRSPSFNPVELAFAYIKRWIRKWAPDEGYSQEGVERAIQRAAAKISPEMVMNWIAGCGYRVARDPENEADQENPEHSEDQENQENSENADDREDDEPEEPANLEGHQVQYRWAGYGPSPPRSPSAGVDETAPEVGFLEADDVYEPEAIVDERFHNGRREVRIRWKSYGPEEDTWEPLKHLLVGGQQLLRNWRKSRRS